MKTAVLVRSEDKKGVMSIMEANGTIQVRVIVDDRYTTNFDFTTEELEEIFNRVKEDLPTYEEIKELRKESMS